jgi:hypothetical protein
MLGFIKQWNANLVRLRVSWDHPPSRTNSSFLPVLTSQVQDSSIELP